MKQETISVAAHFRFILQFLGLAVSFGPSHVTYDESAFCLTAVSSYSWDVSIRHVRSAQRAQDMKMYGNIQDNLPGWGPSVTLMISSSPVLVDLLPRLPHRVHMVYLLLFPPQCSPAFLRRHCRSSRPQYCRFRYRKTLLLFSPSLSYAVMVCLS